MVKGSEVLCSCLHYMRCDRASGGLNSARQFDRIHDDEEN